MANKCGIGKIKRNFSSGNITMTENQGQKWNNMPLKFLEEKLRCLPEVKVPEKLKTRLLAAIPNGRQKISVGYQLKWYLCTRDLTVTAAAIIFILAAMFMVNYGLPNPPRTLLTELNDTSLWYTTWEQSNFLYDQNYILLRDNGNMSYDERR